MDKTSKAIYFIKYYSFGSSRWYCFESLIMALNIFEESNFGFPRFYRSFKNELNSSINLRQFWYFWSFNYLVFWSIFRLRDWIRKSYLFWVSKSVSSEMSESEAGSAFFALFLVWSPGFYEFIIWYQGSIFSWFSRNMSFLAFFWT